jgi:X-X-X-Leu-X-X-Gly heptad repeat protein
MNQLNSGIRKLNTGATTLNNGITKFNKEGINKLSNYSIKVNNYSSKAEALVNLSKNYKGYASTNATETIFVNKVQSIN